MVAARVEIAKVYADLDELILSTFHLKNALQRSPNDAEAHYELGKVQLRTGELEDSVFHLRKAILISPQFAPAYPKLTEVYRLLGDHKKAEQTFARFNEISLSRLPRGEYDPSAAAQGQK